MRAEVDTTVEDAEFPDRTHVPELERRAYNQMPKAGWREPRLFRYDGTDLYQWYAKEGEHSPFEEAFGEPFLMRRRPALSTLQMQSSEAGAKTYEDGVTACIELLKGRAETRRRIAKEAYGPYEEGRAANMQKAEGLDLGAHELEHTLLTARSPQ